MLDRLPYCEGYGVTVTDESATTTADLLTSLVVALTTFAVPNCTTCVACCGLLCAALAAPAGVARIPRVIKPHVSMAGNSRALDIQFLFRMRYKTFRYCVLLFCSAPMRGYSIFLKAHFP